MRIEIRPAVQTDLDAIAALHQEWVEESNTYGLTALPASRLSAWLADCLLAAVVDGEVAGFIRAVVRDGPQLAVFDEGERYLEIEDLFVRSDRRRMGIGGALLDAMLDRANEMGIRRFQVFSAAKDQPAIVRFYERHGFRPWGVQLFR